MVHRPREQQRERTRFRSLTSTLPRGHTFHTFHHKRHHIQTITIPKCNVFLMSILSLYWERQESLDEDIQ